MTLRTVRLSDVYELDMGKRDIDIPMWSGLTSGRYVIEVGSGTGRVPRGVQADLRAVEATEPIAWVGIEVDPRMAEIADRKSPSWYRSVIGDAGKIDPWDRATAAMGRAADVVIIPYSTLFLFDHYVQERVLRLAGGHVVARGSIFVECFLPDNVAPIVEQQIVDGTWKRKSHFAVDAAQRITRVNRYYGPIDGDTEFHVQETIHWRRFGEWPGLIEKAGLSGCEVWTKYPPVPPGNVVIHVRTH